MHLALTLTSSGPQFGGGGGFCWVSGGGSGIGTGMGSGSGAKMGPLGASAGGDPGS
jgi:hypothetical protein